RSLRVRRGQIAHVRAPTVVTVENGAYLCLRHHERYDSRSRQSKGFTPAELIAYRTKLYAAIEARAHDAAPRKATPQGNDRPTPETHDLAIFKAHEQVLPEASVLEVLTSIRQDPGWFSVDVFNQCLALLRRANMPRNRFISKELRVRFEAFADA